MPLRLSPAALLLALAFAPATQAADAPPPVSAQAQAALDRAEALHLKRHYPQALAAYDRLIAQHPAWLRPRYLRWILLVDMQRPADLERELGLEAGAAFEGNIDAAMAHLPPDLRQGKDNPRPWLYQVVRRYLAAKPSLAAEGPARTAETKRILEARDLPPDLRLALEDTLPELDRAEAAHLSHRYAAALVRYDRIIAAHPGQFRPRYLRWILMVDMGALSILHRELGLDADLPFETSLDTAMAHLPDGLKASEANPRPWLHQVTLRYYAAKPTQVANRGDMDLAVTLTRRALATPGLPDALGHDLRANLAVYLSDANRFADTVAAADALEKQYGEPSVSILGRKAAALDLLGRHAQAVSAYRRILARLSDADTAFPDTLPALRGQYTACRDGGDLAQARAILQKIRDGTAAPLPARSGCAPDWSGDYAWIRLQEVRLAMQENRLPEAESLLAGIEKDFAGAPETVFLRATLEHLHGRPRQALAFYNRLEAEETDPDPRTLAGRLAAQSDLGPRERAEARAELARWQAAIPGNPEFAALARRLGAAPPGATAADAEKIWEPTLPWNAGEVLVLCYHDIPDRAPRGDDYAVDLEAFVSHLELLKARGFHFVRLSEVIAAQKGGPKLPPQSVLLTFDDGYQTHHDNLLPILNLYQAPAVLAVVTHWIGHGKGVDAPGSDLCQFAPFMNAAQLREAAADPLVEIVCHSDDLHRAVPMNPFGNTAPAAVSRQWLPGVNPGTGRYESDHAYAERIAQDLRRNARGIRDATGRAPLGIAWPFGAHNAQTDTIARQEGLEALMNLGDGTFRPEDYPGLPRFLMFHSMRLSDLAREIATHARNAPPMRGAYLPLDGLVAPTTAATAKNLDAAVAELTRRRPSHVMLDVSSKALGPCYPTGYPATGANTPKTRDWISHIARAIEVHDMFVILRLCERDRAHLDAILKLPVGEDVFLDFPATREEVAKVRGMRTEGRVLVRLGGPANADLFVCSGPEGDPQNGADPETRIFWCHGEAALAKAAAQGAVHWIGSGDTRFNTTRAFAGRPPADPHWLMMPPAPALKP